MIFCKNSIIHIRASCRVKDQKQRLKIAKRNVRKEEALRYQNFVGAETEYCFKQQRDFWLPFANYYSTLFLQGPLFYSLKTRNRTFRLSERLNDNNNGIWFILTLPYSLAKKARRLKAKTTAKILKNTFLFPQFGVEEIDILLFQVFDTSVIAIKI